MKFSCSVSVGNRLLPTLAIGSKNRHVKSTLALCKHPKKDEYCIIHFTAQDKTGTKYNVKGNISQILTRFINDGKATVQFKQPPHDLYIQAEVIALKGFLHLLKRVLQNKVTEKELTYSSMSVTPNTAKDLPPKKMVIENRSQYPIRGLPRTLEMLYINDIRRCSVDRGIFNLIKLKVLDLSRNCIELVPEELNKLPCLAEINLASNQLGNSSPSQWNWLGGRLSSTLISLNLSSNNLKFLPDQIVKLRQLERLTVNDNELTILPVGFGNLRNLRELHAANNQIAVLPGSIQKLWLKKINVSNNKFASRGNNPPISSKLLPICSLKECAGREVLSSKVNYNSEMIPLTLVRYLDHARYCECGRACFEVFLRSSSMIFLTSIAESMIFGSRDPTMVPIDCYFCSSKCYRNSHSARIRNPVT